jgi:hypothetical protein
VYCKKEPFDTIIFSIALNIPFFLIKQVLLENELAGLTVKIP